MCYTIRANSKKAVPVLSPAKEVIVSIFEAVASFVVPKNHLIIFLFSRLSIVIFKKYIFLFSLLTRRVKVYIMYSVCFYLDCFCPVLQMVNKKADLLLKVDLFLLQNLPIIARSLSGSIPKK